MKERIILAPGINGNELIKNFALHGVNNINTRIVSTGELARLVLMRSGISISEHFLDSREEIAFVSEAIKGITYFGTPSYSDVKNIALALRRMRSLVPDQDELAILKETLQKGIFEAKNEALYIAYERYIRLLKDKNYIDSIMLIRKAIDECSPIDAEFIVLEEFPLNPLATALLDKVSDGTYVQLSIKSLFKVSDNPIKISSIKNCYGASNEVETILADIYSDKKLDACSVAVTDPGTYGQLFYDYALIYDIPITFGCGVPIINSNPAKLLSLYYQWTTSGFFGADALKKMLFNKVFNRSKLMELFPEQGNDFRWSRFYQYLGDISFTNVKKDNHIKMDAFAKAVEAEAKYIVEGESKEYREYVYKVKCIPLLEIMADELALPAEVFVSKYAYIRNDDSKISTKMLKALDLASNSTIYNELASIRDTGASQTEEDTILNILKLNVMSQRSKPGHLHITSIDMAISSIRNHLYIAGLSASKYPGSPKENYLLLDSDLDLFGEGAKGQKSGEKIERKINAVLQLAELASDLGAEIQVSYSGLNVAELKRDNASSLVYELYSKMSGAGASFDDLEKTITKIEYFEPAISASRLIGKAYIEGKRIDHKELEPDDSHYKWNIDKAYAPTTIETFFSCPRRFMLSQILGIPEPDDNNPFEVMSAKDVGTIAHSLMEHLSDNYDMTLAEFLDLSREFFDRTLDEHPPLIPDKVEAVRMEFLEMMENAFNDDPHRKVVLKEEDIQCEHSTGIKLHGFPDRVEMLDDGTCLIVDFKTKRKIEHVEDDFSSCFQIIVYAYLMESLGYKVSGGEFRYIRLGQTVTCKYDELMKKQLEFALTQFREAMQEGHFPCSIGDCTYCKFAGNCISTEESDSWEGLNEWTEPIA